jgi:hypothetical protein
MFIVVDMRAGFYNYSLDKSWSRVVKQPCPSRQQRRWHRAHPGPSGRKAFQVQSQHLIINKGQ